MLAQAMAPQTLQIQFWPIDRFVFYARNPRKNDSAVDRMCSSIREFGFEIPVLARSDGTVVDGHLRLKSARKLGSWPGGDTTGIPVMLCDEWSEAQVKAFRLMVNRSVTWANWDEELLALELQELNEADFDLSLTGFDPKEIDDLRLVQGDDDRANAAPPIPENPVSRPGDLWLCGNARNQHRILGADATDPGAVSRLLGERKPLLLVTDPPYGIELDSEWRDRAGLNGCGPAEASYMKHRTEGHTETTISGDTRADWSEAFELVPSLQIAYVWHASVFTREVLNGLLRIGFLYPQQIICNKGRIVLTRTHYWCRQESHAGGPARSTLPDRVRLRRHPGWRSSRGPRRDELECPAGYPLQSDTFRIDDEHVVSGLTALLANQRINLHHDPVCLAIHLACPRFRYLDRGKGSIGLGGDDE